MRTPRRRRAIVIGGERLQLARHRAIDIEEAAMRQFAERHHHRAGEARDVVHALERFMRKFGNGIRQNHDAGQRHCADCSGHPSTNANAVEQPERRHQNNADQSPSLPQQAADQASPKAEKTALSGSITITSRKVTVIQVILNLNCDTAIRSSNIASDSKAATAGRRRITSQTQLSAIQASRNRLWAKRPISVCNSLTTAATWIACRQRQYRPLRREKGLQEPENDAKDAKNR